MAICLWILICKLHNNSVILGENCGPSKIGALAAHSLLEEGNCCTFSGYRGNYFPSC